MHYHLHHSRKVVGLLLVVAVFAAEASAKAAASGATTPSGDATGLMFEFSPPVSDRFWQTVVSTMEGADLSKWFGHPVVAMEKKRTTEATELGDLVQVTLGGDCNAGLAYESNGDGALGWVYLLDGRIQRFVFVDCNQIAHMLRAELRDKPLGKRQRVMARAISYVVIHELAHIATQDPGHQQTGLLKSHATKSDLLSGARDLLKQELVAVSKSEPGPEAGEPRQAARFEPEFW